MLTYVPGDTVAHRLDPRSKLLFQAGFGIAAFSHRDPVWLAGATLVGVGVLGVARLSPLAVLRRLWFVLVFLVAAPLIAGVTVAPVGFDIASAARSALSVGRLVPILFVSAAYVRTTPARDTRATVQRAVPGRPGQLLGVGVGLTVRFFPVLLHDLRSARSAVEARAGDRLSTVERARRVAVVGLSRAVERADRLSVALRARCFAYNPTLPKLRFSGPDYPILLTGVVLALTPLL